MEHIVLDLTSLACQPKSRERFAHPKRHVTSAQSEQKSAYPAHTRDLEEDEGDEPLVLFVQTTPLSLITKMISLLCSQQQEKNL